MSIETDFLSMMPSTVTVYAKTSADAYGKMAYNPTGTAVRCRIQQTGRVVKTENNRDVFEEGQVIFYGTPTITADSKIVLPDGSSPLILSIRLYNDDTGPHHTTVSFGKA